MDDLPSPDLRSAPEQLTVKNKLQRLADIMGYGDYKDLPLVDMPSRSQEFMEALTNLTDNAFSTINIVHNNTSSVIVPTWGTSKADLLALTGALALDGGIHLDRPVPESGFNQPDLVRSILGEIKEDSGCDGGIKKLFFSDTTGSALAFMQETMAKLVV